MSTFWDGIKKNLKVWGDAAAEKAEEIGKAAATKTEELTRVGKVKLEIHQLQRDLEKNFQELGKFVFESANDNLTNFSGNETFLSYVDTAQGITDQIKEKEEKIQSIKEEFGQEESTEETATASEDNPEPTGEM